MKDILSGLNDVQKEAVLHTEGPLLVLAGAGTGKTRVITHRIAYLLEKGVSPYNILGITFTNKAAEEMKKRVVNLSPENGRYVWISTFHSFAAKILRVEAKYVNLRKDYIIYDESDQKSLIKKCMQELNIDDKKYKVGMIQDVIARAKDNLIDSGSYSIHAVSNKDNLREIISSIYSLYQRKLESYNAVDFGDLLLKLVDLFYTRDEVKVRYETKFQYILVDEYQDTNRAQYMLVKYLASGHKNLCAVGDEDQAIYSWRGASIRNILEFEKDYPEVKMIRLEQNYRSPKNILDCAGCVIRNNVQRKGKTLWTEKISDESVEICNLDNEIEEAGFVAEKIENLHYQKNLEYNNFAVFYRTNAQSRVFEDMFRKKRIPYKIIGSLKFYERKEIKDIISYMRLTLNPDDDISLKRIINVPHRNIGENTMKHFEEYSGQKKISLWESLHNAQDIGLSERISKKVKEFIQLINSFRQDMRLLSGVELINRIINETGYIDGLQKEDTFQAKERVGNLEEFLSAIGEYEETEAEPGIEGFLTNVALTNEVDMLDRGPEAENVILMTLHLAKGLEFDTVFITGMEEGLFPIGSSLMADNLDELEEERRLCYVGITRAIKKLYLSYTDSRRVYGQIKLNVPSRFIQEARQSMEDIPVKTGFELKEVIQEESEGDSTLKIGDRVKHPDFGTGRILDIKGTRDNIKVTVVFESGTIKKLLVKYANLDLC